jgi:hypothetical protein
LCPWTKQGIFSQRFTIITSVLYGGLQERWSLKEVAAAGDAELDLTGNELHREETEGRGPLSFCRIQQWF